MIFGNLSIHQNVLFGQWEGDAINLLYDSLFYSQCKGGAPVPEYISKLLDENLGADSPAKDARKAIWRVLEDDCCFLSRVADVGISPNLEGIDALKEIFSWVFHQIGCWCGESAERCIKLEIILAIFKKSRLNLSESTSMLEFISPDFVDDVETYILEWEYSVENDVFGMFRGDALNSYKQMAQSDKAHDWGQVMSAVDREWARIAGGEISQCVNFLLCFDRARLVKVSDNINCSIKALVFVYKIDVHEILRVADESTSFHVKFLAVYEFLKRPETIFDEDVFGCLSDIIYTFSLIEGEWEAWLLFYNKYPVRFPSLQKPLGKAMSRMSERAIDQYMGSLALDLYPGECREYVRECLIAFSTHSDATLREFAWRSAYEKWSTWNFAIDEPSSSVFNVSSSVLDYAVIYYFLLSCSLEYIRAEVNEYERKVNEVAYSWFDSKSTCLSARGRVLSRLQPKLCALSILESTGGCLTDQLFRESLGNRHENAYYQLKFDT